MFKKVDKATTFDLEEANKNAKGGNEMFFNSCGLHPWKLGCLGGEYV